MSKRIKTNSKSSFFEEVAVFLRHKCLYSPQEQLRIIADFEKRNVESLLQ
ncbi:hypothetical protein MG296_10495 [Flavobacteriaceae bacterium TK19130]|nr:hypothetical protein [Thermobacterium salinum]